MRQSQLSMPSIFEKLLSKAHREKEGSVAPPKPETLNILGLELAAVATPTLSLSAEQRRWVQAKEGDEVSRRFWKDRVITNPGLQRA